MSQESCLGASESLLGLLSQEWWAAFLPGCGLAGEHPSPRWAGAGRWELKQSGAGVRVPWLHLLLMATWARVEELDFLLMKADYRVAATRCSNALQAASKALGKNPPCFAGLSHGGATVSDKRQGCLCPREARVGQSHGEEWTRWE